MRNIIKLRDFNINTILDAFKEDCRTSRRYTIISIDNFKIVLDHFLRDDLKYNCKLGRTSSNECFWAEYSFKEQIPVYNDPLEVLEGELLPVLIQRASTLQRGYGL